MTVPIQTAPHGYRTLVDLVRHRAQQFPDETVYTFLVDGESEEVNLTYATLDRQARAIAAALQAAGASGERAILLFPPGPHYITAFLGALYAGATAVPVYPPKGSRPDPRFEAIFSDADVKVALTDTDTLADQRTRSVVSAFPDTRWIATDDLGDDGLADRWTRPAIDRETVAFLQYTSGSLATPKGVMVTHGNLMENERMMQAAFPCGPGDVGISWLPLYHDMGLIGTLLQPLYSHYRIVLMSPLAFLQRPVRWLQAISRYRATGTAGPNFAYDLCARKVTPEQIATLDLSLLKVAINGAEPVRWETLERFAEVFAPCGFRREAFFPAYGLAEATLLVAGARSGPGGPSRLLLDAHLLEQHQVAEVSSAGAGARPIVGCGELPTGVTVRIVDPERLTECPADQVGEIWVSSDSVAAGYWNRPEESALTFGARLESEGDRTFLRTGDLGFMHRGQLYVTGRLKDLIVIRGENHYPQDIEWTAQQSHAALRPEGCAAFATMVDGQEQVVVAAEIERQHRKGNLHEVALAIQTAVTQRHAVTTYAVVLLLPGGLPKTSSGKVQRRTCAAGFRAGNLDAVFALVKNQPLPDWGKGASS